MEYTKDQIADIREKSWIQGERSALTRQLTEALKGLMYGPEFTTERLIKEREETISALRTICEEYGDNDWDENLHLPDVINKHLRNHLE